MPRSRTGTLPPLKSIEPDEAWPSPRADSRALQRIDNLEDRLILQERTTHSLIERAYKIKEDIIDNLNITHGSWHEEKKARELLQDHIRTITDVVRKLNKDIVFLENQIHSKQVMSDGMNSAVKTLEVSHVTDLADLRGRIARCDASIARLASDLKTCYESIRTLNQTHLDSNAKLVEKIHNMDTKIGTLMTRLDKLSNEQELQIRSLGSDSSQQMAALDTKTQTMIGELQASLKSFQVVEESEREKLEARLTGLIDKSRVHCDTNKEKLNRKVDEKAAILLQKINKLEEEIKHEHEINTASQKAFEHKLSGVVNTQLKQQADDLSRLKRECHEGFTTVHDSISNMKQVSDGKQKLLEEQLRKEISQIRKMIVLI